MKPGEGNRAGSIRDQDIQHLPSRACAPEINIEYLTGHNTPIAFVYSAEWFCVASVLIIAGEVIEQIVNSIDIKAGEERRSRRPDAF
jgi:hypothetical protein